MSHSDDGRLAADVARARAGDRRALEAVVRAVRDDVYNLALRMLWHPEDAEDAAQEILIKVVTRLDRFEGRSAFRTWVWRVAANHLLTARRRRAERPELTFEAFGADLETGLDMGAAQQEPDVERDLLIEEVKIGCSQGMLLCLDRDHRLAYILGEILGLDHREGSDVLEITPDAFRKRLSRARAKLHAFLRQRCGLVNADVPCRCDRRVERAIELGRVARDRLLFAEHPHADPDAVANWQQVEAIRDEASVLRSNPLFADPDRLGERLREVLQTRVT
jgi:RNA polymerase sigma factor (sigma-70 family)